MSSRTAIASCEELAAQQNGVVSWTQCRERGLERYVLDRLIERGAWQRLHPRVYLPRPVPDGWWARASGATLWAGRGAVLSGRAAARARNIYGFEHAQVEVATHRSRRNAPIVVHHYPRLPLGPAEILRNVPVIPTDSMLFELCRTEAYRRARRVMGDLIRAGRTSEDSIKRMLDRIGGKGMAGTKWIRALLDERVSSEEKSETDAEVAFARLAAGWGMDVVPQYRLWRGHELMRRFDFAIPQSKLGIEIDGSSHEDAFTRNDDEAKDEIALGLGWRILRFKDEEVFGDPGRVHDRIAEAMRNPPERPKPPLPIDRFGYPTDELGDPYFLPS